MVVAPCPFEPPRTVIDSVVDDPSAKSCDPFAVRTSLRFLENEPPSLASMKSVKIDDVEPPDVKANRNIRSTLALDPKVSGPVMFVGEGGLMKGPVVNTIALPAMPPEIGRTQYWVDLASPG